MNRTTTRTNRETRRGLTLPGVAALSCLLLAPALAEAQLDPLLFIKRVPPTVILVMDTSFQMLNDGNPGPSAMWPNGSIYDTGRYNVADASPELKTALNLPSTATYYRRIYHNLQYSTSMPDAANKYTVDSIEAVPDTDYRYNYLWRNTRYDIARLGVHDAVDRNRGANFRWGLLKLRQDTPVRRTTCDKPVVVPASSPLYGLSDTGGCDGGGLMGIFATTVSALNSTALSSTATLVSPAAGTAQSVLDIVGTDTGNGADSNTSLIPAGLDGMNFEDRPLKLALTDAQSAATSAIAADSACPGCRNTVIVLLTAGRDYSADPATKAAELKTLSASGTHKVPVFVVWLRPNLLSPSYMTDQLQLQSIADSSGGVLIRAWDRSSVARAINLALQTGFSRPTDLNNQSARVSSEYYPVSPVIGTVNLENVTDASGTVLPNSVVTLSSGDKIPQRNNMMITAGFGLGIYDAYSCSWCPGFNGRLRAYRTFKPVADSTKPSGYTFEKDGTPLWPDRDGRPALAGLARTPASSANRNIYTYIPGTGMVAFRDTNAATIGPHLGSWTSSNPSLNPSTLSAATLINWVRALPLGSFIGSTPAIMDPPSLDPPPDTDYGRPEGTGTYAGDHKNRRAIIWIGANDGMLHAIDARTGYEVWAFIPFNLLPKLRALYEFGQPVEQFNYFIDQSPKIAEVKMSGTWRSYLIIGDGPGGTFYQAFDVTEAGMGGPDPNSDDVDAVLATFASTSRIEFKWAFPDYGNFDTTMRQDIWLTSTGTATGTATDATPGSVHRVYGELKSTASAAEKTVGTTWSDPAVGALNLDRSVNAAIVGSGYFPAEAESTLAGRTGVSVGHALYVINLATGKLVGNTSGSACGGTGCLDVGDTSTSPKNAIQADPTVTGDSGAYVAKWAYIGDLDGKYYRIAFNATGTITSSTMKTAGQPIYASSALMYVGTVDRYLFFMTGSDLLPSAPSSAGGTGQFELIGMRDSNGSFSDSFTPIKLATVTNSGGLPIGERPATSPAVAGEIVFFTTTTDAAPGCASTPAGAQTDSTYNLYAVTYKGSGAYAGQATQVDSKGKKNAGSNAPILFQSGAGRATAPFVVDQHLYFATTGSTGPNVEAYGDPKDFNNGVGQVGVRILSWREIRR